MLPKYATSRKTNENVLPFSTHYRLKIQPERNIIFLERTLGKGTEEEKKRTEEIDKEWEKANEDVHTLSNCRRIHGILEK